MIVINSAMQQGNIKDLLETTRKDDISFTFKEKKGIQMHFDYTGETDAAVRLAKDLIKGTDWGKVLYFNVIAK